MTLSGRKQRKRGSDSYDTSPVDTAASSSSCSPPPRLTPLLFLPDPWQREWEKHKGPERQTLRGPSATVTDVSGMQRVREGAVLPPGACEVDPEISPAGERTCPEMGSGFARGASVWLPSHLIKVMFLCL